MFIVLSVSERNMILCSNLKAVSRAVAKTVKYYHICGLTHYNLNTHKSPPVLRAALRSESRERKEGKGDTTLSAHVRATYSCKAVWATTPLLSRTTSPAPWHRVREAASSLSRLSARQCHPRGVQAETIEPPTEVMMTATTSATVLARGLARPERQ